MAPADLAWSIASAAALVAAALAAWGAFAARGSTAVPAAAWAVVAAVVLAAEAAGHASGRLADPAAAAAARLVTVALGVCPAMSLLGAKRPQHGAWQFIVATLAVVVALPALAALLVRPGTTPDVDPLRRWFLLVLVAVGWMNFAATRRGLAATLVASGQLLVARRFLPFIDGAADTGASLDAIAACLLAAGATLAVGQALRWRPTLATRAPWIDPPFLALRETLGAAWALRIAERFNAVASERGWPCRLRFAGLDGDADGPWRSDAERAFRALARRFASAAWLRRHAADVPPMAVVDRGR